MIVSLAAACHVGIEQPHNRVIVSLAVPCGNVNFRRLKAALQEHSRESATFLVWCCRHCMIRKLECKLAARAYRSSVNSTLFLHTRILPGPDNIAGTRLHKIPDYPSARLHLPITYTFTFSHLPDYICTIFLCPITRLHLPDNNPIRFECAAVSRIKSESRAAFSKTEECLEKRTEELTVPRGPRVATATRF